MRLRKERQLRRWSSACLPLLVGLALLAGCADNASPIDETPAPSVAAPDAAAQDKGEYKFNVEIAPMGKSSGVCYEIFVRSFYDSDGDGIGDLQGVIAKLDYLEELGVKGIWLMPINPSPSYHGYDVTDYYGVNPEYGTLDDLRELLDEAHDRDIKVLMDFVVNHASSEHPWFVDAAGSKDSPYRDWFVWADGTAEVPEMGPWGQAVWHPSGDERYLGVFWGGMPDFNLDNPEVRREMIAIGQYWLQFGFDGFRLDAAKHIYEDFGTSTNDPATWDNNKQWWQEFRQGVKEAKQDAYLIGEVWDSLSVVGPFLDNALDSGFNFDLSKLLLTAARKEEDSSIASTLNKMYAYFGKQSDGKFVDAPFLTNHDSNRVMNELGGNVDHAKMAASLLLTMPGNPFIYYGEEIGMLGVKPDERIREPMLWTTDRTAAGQTTWQPASSNGDTVAVDEQLKDPDSLLNHYKKLIAWRNEEPLLGNGGITPFRTEQKGVVAYVRIDGEAKLLVVHNLTGEVLSVDLDANGVVPFSTVRFDSSGHALLKEGQLELAPYSTAVLQ